MTLSIKALLPEPEVKIENPNRKPLPFVPPCPGEEIREPCVFLARVVAHTVDDAAVQRTDADG